MTSVPFKYSKCMQHFFAKKIHELHRKIAFARMCLRPCVLHYLYIVRARKNRTFRADHRREFTPTLLPARSVNVLLIISVYFC